MKRMLFAGLAAGLMIVLAACSGFRGAGPVSPPSPHREVPVVLAALNSNSPDSADAAFAVAEVGPSGTVPHENLEGGIWVLFNKPVIALKTLDKPASSSTILSITPRIEGIYRWYGSRLLAFEPKGPLAPATEYAFSVIGSLRSLQGEALTGDRRFTFRTEPLQVVSVTPSGDDVVPEASRQVVLTFNFPVDMKTVLPSVRLEVSGTPVAFKAARPVITDRTQLGPYENTDRLVVLTPEKELPWDTDIMVRVLKGAKPRPENYGTEADITEGFHTLRPLAIEETNVSMDRVGATAELRFNHSIKEDSAAANLKLDAPNYKMDKNLEVSGSWVMLHNVPADFDSSFAVDVLSGMTDIYGQKLGQDLTESFKVGPAAAYVDFRNTGQKILEAQFPPKVAVEMQNVDSGKYLISRITNPFGKPPRGPAAAIDTGRITRNVRHFELFDLLPFLNDAGKGAAFLSWSFKGLFEGSDTAQEVKDDLVVQVTDIGASLNVGYNSLLVMASSLASGAPIQNAVVSLRKDGKTVASGRTDEKGLATVAIPPGTLAAAFKGTEEKAEVEIAKGKDRLVLRPSEMPGRTWNANEPYSAEEAKPLTYIWSDRGIYRPGETLSFAGIDRDLALGAFTPVQGKFRVDLLNGSDDSQPAGSATGAVSASGSFSGQIVFPKDAEPGDWLLSFHRIAGKSDVKTGTAYVQVANFRRVAFTVDLSLPETRAFMGGSLDGRFSGSYLAGGAVTRGKWSWFWTRRETWYQPPGDALSEYTFGDVEKGWAEDLASDSGSLSGTSAETVASQKLSDGEKGRVYSYELVATVEDIDRQAISKRDSQLVFSTEQMLGAKLTSDAKSEDSLYFVTKGQPFTLKAVSVDPDGKPYPSAAVSGRLIREDWKLVRELTVGGMVDTRYEKEEVEEKTFTVKPGQPFGSVELATQKSGSYAIELSGKDAKARESFTRLTFYSTGSDEIIWQRSDERQLEIVPDKKIYAPGDTARLLIKSPLSKGTYLISVERDGVLEKRTLDLTGSAPTIDVHITDEHVPMVYVFVAVSTGRTKPPAEGPDAPDFGKPRGYSGLAEIPVETASRTITLSISNAKDSYLPGSDATVTLKALRNGQPLAGAEIALVAADRGVLDLIDYHIPNPVGFFYSTGNFPDKVAHFDSRDLLMDPVTWKANDLPGGDEKGESAPAGPGVGVRKNFNPTAVFRTGLITGQDGTVSVRFKLPDLLTKFRSTAVAVKDDAFGIAEGEILVQNPINVRTALPRRMRVGDAATAGVVLTNIDAKQHRITVGINAQGVSISGDQKKTVTLNAGDTAEVAFDMSAPSEGTAKLAFNVDSDILRERLEDSLAVADPHLTESFTIVGKTSDLANEALVVPSSFFGVPEEGLYLSLDSTIASALAGAVRFLDVYPYDCLEQVTSKLFARVLFPALSGGAAPDLTTVQRFANADGGFSYWDDPAPRRSNYYVTLRVAHLLAAAQSKGMKIPPEIDVDAMLSWLEKSWENKGTYLQAYALYVLSMYGRSEKAWADTLARQGDKIGVFGYGFLGLSYYATGDTKSAQAVLTRLKNFVRVGTRTVTLVGTVNDWLWYGGGLQAKALLLMLYARVQPDSQLVLGLANDLLASNTTGYWENTSNAGWVLQAFSEIVTRGNETNADFTASVKLGNTELARNIFRGFSRKPFLKQVSAKDLESVTAQERGKSAPSGTLLPLSFGLSGKGTLYYTAELRTAMLAAGAEPRDEGIGIATEILDDKGAIVPGTDLALGRVYTMRIVFYSSQDRTYLALRAPIPSGAEPIDGSLLTSQIVKPPARQENQDQGDTDNGDSGYTGDYGEFGYTTHIYDDEVRFYFDQLDRGKHEVTFLFRTTTPGVYPTPPTRAELMYQPEVFGRTGGTVYRILK
ncbi:MAG: alpha-2-macroglobulin family protein [Spirochaetia bacterium]